MSKINKNIKIIYRYQRNDKQLDEAYDFIFKKVFENEYKKERSKNDKGRNFEGTAQKEK